eukprot:Gregarina_sp_Pseudo_9__2844@NODE_3073_length_761_cov_8_713296_g2803_i0_p1_GENE_NODE_3073_length_761_cov_8_713296_g2803_i0NODE_3073_length_761_cov_8_713296_g2803_i0_p1_ORF_typecomplete_len119_score1_67DUF853/PF05872_12/0_23_NODE_3073_length_761_cov_8_713296_g2803_i091447
MLFWWGALNHFDILLNKDTAKLCFVLSPESRSLFTGHAGRLERHLAHRVRRERSENVVLFLVKQPPFFGRYYLIVLQNRRASSMTFHIYLGHMKTIRQTNHSFVSSAFPLAISCMFGG